MKQHFITFYSPGTFVAEQSTKPIESWDVELALQLVVGIKGHHGVVPYGFRFSTRSRGDNDLDSTETESSHMYYLGGKVRTRAKVEEDNLQDERILRENMRTNNWQRVIENNNSWKCTLPLTEKDVVLAFVQPK